MVSGAAGPVWKESSRPAGEQSGQLVSSREKELGGGCPALRTHRAVTPTRQDPQVVHFAVHFQSGPGKDRNGVRGCVLPHESQVCPSPSPKEPATSLRLLGPALAQVKDLPGVEVPEEGLDDLGTLWGTGG